MEVLYTNMYKLLVFTIILSWLICALSESSVLPISASGNWTVIPGPDSGVLESITVSSNYLWGIDNRTAKSTFDANVVYCQRPCCNVNSWKDAYGQLDETIDANESEVWGVNNRGQIYKRAIDGSGGWIQVSGGAHTDCRSLCFSDASVSNNGYIWALSRQNDTYMLCRGGVGRGCGNNNQMLIDDEVSLVHIEAGDEEVWGVNASNHIFKRPINGSGEWSIVPGRMRYISASGNAHIWGIAPNNNLYVCAKPCSGDWEYIGGSFKQVDGGNNSVIGVTTDNTVLGISVKASDFNTETQTPSQVTISTDPVTGTDINQAYMVPTLIGSTVGAFLLITTCTVTLLAAICYYKCCRTMHSHAVRNKKKTSMFNLNKKDNNHVAGIPNQIATTEFSVQSSFKLNLPPHLIITASSVKLKEIIGQGEFGIVYKAHIVKHKDGQVVFETMAVKTLKGFHDKHTVKELLKECTKMYSLNHPNVLTLSGVCLDGGTAPYIIMPFMANGSLLTYLKNNRSKLIVSQEDNDDEEVDTLRKQLMDMCLQIAKGMEYLTGMKVVHRDLAARNCMIDVNFIIKLADFGLSERVEMKEYFRQDKDIAIKLPLKWLAPECLDDYIFSEKSDVWAYGVTCWEIFSGGKAPYPGVVPTNLPRMLSEGHRLEKPINAACNDEMYALMLQCWKLEPEKRPPFSDLVNSLSQSIEAMAGYMDVCAFGLEKSQQAELIASSYRSLRN